MSWKRRSTFRLSLLSLATAALLASPISPTARAQTTSFFTFSRTPGAGPPGSLVMIEGVGCPGQSVGLTFAPVSGPGPALNFTLPVGPNGTWFLRPLNIPAGAPSGNYQIRAVCVINGVASAPAVGDFIVRSAFLARSETVARSSPSLAAVRGFERLDLVVRDAEGGIQWTTDLGGGFTQYVGLGAPSGGVVGDPAILSWAPGRLDLFVRGADNKLWQRFSTNGGGTWSGWIKPVGDEGVLASGPDVTSRGPGLIDVFVQGTDARMYQRFWDGSRWNGAWLAQGGRPGSGTPDPPGGVNGTPTAVSPDRVRVETFARDTADHLWQQSWTGSSWTNWFGPGFGPHTLASRPDAASWGPEHISVFVRGTDGGLYQTIYVNGWFHFQRLGYAHEGLLDGPGATSRGPGRIDVAVRGTDNRIYIWFIG